MAARLKNNCDGIWAPGPGRHPCPRTPARTGHELAYLFRIQHAPCAMFEAGRLTDWLTALPCLTTGLVLPCLAVPLPLQTLSARLLCHAKAAAPDQQMQPGSRHRVTRGRAVIRRGGLASVEGRLGSIRGSRLSRERALTYFGLLTGAPHLCGAIHRRPSTLCWTVSTLVLQVR
jgi:hypothetical protein